MAIVQHGNDPHRGRLEHSIADSLPEPREYVRQMLRDGAPLLEIHTDPEWLRPLSSSYASVALPENVSSAAMAAIESDLDAALASQGYAPGGVPRFGLAGFFRPTDASEIRLSFSDGPVDRNLVSQVERIVAVNTNQDARTLIVPFPEGTPSAQACEISRDVHAYMRRRSLPGVDVRVHGTHAWVTANGQAVPQDLYRPLERIVEMNTSGRDKWQQKPSFSKRVIERLGKISAIMPTAHLYDA